MSRKQNSGSRPIRLGLIGCGGIVQKSHLHGLLDIPDLVTISAIADPIPENRNRVGTATDIVSEQRYEDHRHMLARAELDAVIIATPHHLHAEHVIEAAQAGVAIISEKPMATSLGEADRLLDAVKKHNVSYTIVHNFLYTPGTVEALRILREENTGTPQTGRALSLFGKTEDQADPNSVWRASKAAGGGCIGDSAYHEIYLIETMIGSPVRYVEARVQTKFFDFDVDDVAFLLFEHENGAISTVSTSWGMPGSGDHNICEVYTRTHGIRIVGRGRELLHLDKSKRKWQPIDLDHGLSTEALSRAGHANYFAATFKALAEDKPPPITAEHARHNLSLIHARAQSNHTAQGRRCHRAIKGISMSNPNIIYIYGDDLGRGMLSCYGQKHFQTPNIDRLAREGLQFTRAYGCIFCAPARASLMTGYHDAHAGRWTFTRGGLYRPMAEGTMTFEHIAELINNTGLQERPDEVFLAQIAQRAGYVTGQIGKLEWGFATTPERIRRHGWDYHYGYYDHQLCHGFYPPFLFEKWRHSRNTRQHPSRLRQPPRFRIPGKRDHPPRHDRESHLLSRPLQRQNRPISSAKIDTTPSSSSTPRNCPTDPSLFPKFTRA